MVRGGCLLLASAALPVYPGAAAVLVDELAERIQSVSARNQRRHAAACKYLICLTAKQKPRGTASAMRCHHNKVTALILCSTDDAIGRVLILYVDAIAGYPVRLPALNRVVKNAVRCRSGKRLELPDRVGPAILSRFLCHFERRPWLGHCYNRNPRICELGQGEPVFECFCGQLRAVGCN